jgi:MFS family permease
VVACYGAGGILLGRAGGSAADRFGRPQTALTGAALCTVGVLGLAYAPTAWSLALLYFGIGCASAFVWAGLNTIAIESFPDNRAGAVSAYSAFKFVGVAVGPPLYVPLLDAGARLPLLAAAGFAALSSLLVLPWLRWYRRSLEAGLEASRAPTRA